MGLRDILTGRHQVKGPAPDRLFAICTAYITLQAEHRQWDSRSPVERDADGHLEQLARILAEREMHAAGGPAEPQRRALLSRMRRPR